MEVPFKVVSGHQLYPFPPCIWFKRRQGTRQFHPKKFFQVNAKTNKYSNAVLLHVQSDTGNLYKVVSLKSSQWRLSKRPSWAIFKNANPELFIITIFIHSTFAPWLYLNTSTCTITHPPWWEIPFADNTIRIRINNGGATLSVKKSILEGKGLDLGAVPPCIKLCWVPPDPNWTD